MKAALVSIGNELLIGQVVDTNSVFIAKKLEQIGCNISEKMAISDDASSIISALNRYQNQVDLVVFTGGLGPTKDDVTKQVLCEYFDDHLELNLDVLKHIEHLLFEIYQRPISEINRQQAFVPSKAEILFNHAGTAPGMLFRKEQTTFISLPGVPFEMRELMEKEVLPYIQKNFRLKSIIHQTVVTAGIGESLLAEYIEDWENSLEALGISLAYLPKLGMVRLRLSASSYEGEQLKTIIQQKIQELYTLIPQYIISENEDEELIDLLIRKLNETHSTLSIAESFTGGALAQEFTKRAGASSYFKGGMVTYATEIKTDLLGVNANIIEKHGVVSEAVAKEMATCCRRKFNTSFALATTGNAGPSKGDDQKGVGVVCLAVATPTNTFSQSFDLGQPRSKVIELAIQKIIQMLLGSI